MVPGELANVAFSLWGLYRANVYRGSKGTSGAVVTSYVRIEDAIIGVQ